MISGIFHSGSGLGNQLFRYIATRVLALDKGYDFSMVAPELFKGKDFMDLDMGNQKYPTMYVTGQPSGQVMPSNVDIPQWFENTKYYNPDFNFIEDNTIIDGNFEDERYFGHRLDEIDKWLKVEPVDIPDDLCIIGFRGGEYKGVPELFLPKEYWEKAMAEMLKINPKMRFEVRTDDPETAKEFFPDAHVFHEIGMDWRSMRYAKHAIIANSSFFILPRLLNGGVTIAPRWWNRYNTKQWDYPQSFYKSFTYIHHEKNTR